MQIEDLTHNSGYVMIKLDDIDIINNYLKIVHIINVTEYEVAKETIKRNINYIMPKSERFGPLFRTINHGFNLLEDKIKFLKPHYRIKRGLLNIVGKGMKFLTGVMDSDDEIEIMNRIDLISKNNKQLLDESNKQIQINSRLNEQIKNIAFHIKNEQNNIENYFNNYSLIVDDKIRKIGNEVNFMEHVYQINYDINLLKDHVDNIEQIILTSKLGILTKNILTSQELDLVKDINGLKDIKIVVSTYKKEIIIVVMIPEYEENIFTRILIEQIPNNKNMSLDIDSNVIISDKNNTAYYFPVKENLKKNLIEIKDNCVSKIVKVSESASCNFCEYKEQEIKEVSLGIILTKNILNTKITHNCNNLNISIEGNKLIKYENCKIKINENIYDNVLRKIYENIVLPNFLTKVIENNTYPKIKLEDLNIKQIDNRKEIEEIIYSNENNYKISWGIDILLILFVTIIIIFIFLKRFRIKRDSDNNFNIKFTSSEPQTKRGGVMESVSLGHIANII